MTNAEFDKMKPPVDVVERTWQQAFADWRKAKEEKARVVAAMLRAGEQQKGGAHA